jgi:hypothetical protein
MTQKKRDEQYSEKETEQRFERALRGAFKTPVLARKDVPPSQRAKEARKRRAKASSSS